MKIIIIRKLELLFNNRQSTPQKKNIVGSKERHFIVRKGSFYQDDVAILDV